MTIYKKNYHIRKIYEEYTQILANRSDSESRKSPTRTGALEFGVKSSLESINESAKSGLKAPILLVVYDSFL